MIEQDALALAQETMFLRWHKGFVPDKYPSKNLHKTLTNMLHGQKFGNIYMSNGGKDSRPNYHAEDKQAEALTNVGVYNSCTDQAGKFNAQLVSEYAYPILPKIQQTLQQGFTVILPFANEAGSIQGNIAYAQSKVGAKNVYAIDAQTDPQAGKEAKETDAFVLRQKDILRHVDWKTLRDEHILPTNFEGKGTKGLTMYAGLLALEAQDNLVASRVMFHDTDITNPTAYNALEFLAIPHAFPVGEINGTQLLLSGDGRNNEPWTQTANLLEMFPSEQLQKVALLLSRLGWPLTGERELDGAVIHSLPFSSGMTIETLLNYHLAGLDAQSGINKTMQVCVNIDNPKVENKPSPRPREYGIVSGVAKWGTQLAYQTLKTGKLPHEWDIEDLQRFNHDSRPAFLTMAAPPEKDHHPNHFIRVPNDPLLPSMKQLRTLNIVDWEGIKDAIK